MANDGRLVWIDCEMTGLDLRTDALVEIAVLVTDSDLNILGDGVDVVIKPPDAALAGMLPIVKEMHEASGLINEIPHGLTLAEAESKVMDYVREYVPEPRRAPLAGSSVYTDRGFISRDLPTLDDHLHYRLVDVSTIKELSRRWYPRAYYNAPEKHGGHRALADIKDSIAELRYYREAVFVPDPGPDGATSKEIASRHGSDPAAPGASAEGPAADSDSDTGEESAPGSAVS
jgi:oligoribonuclease